MDNQPNIDDFQDPLEDFEPKEFDDELERVLVEEEIGSIRHEPYVKIPPDTTVEQAIKKLAGLHIACLLVADADKLVGVFSERDVLTKVAPDYESVKNTMVTEVMTSDPIYVFETDSAVSALSVMAICGYRHVPIVDLNDNLTGIISPQRIVEFLRKHFD